MYKEQTIQKKTPMILSGIFQPQMFCFGDKHSEAIEFIDIRLKNKDREAKTFCMNNCIDFFIKKMVRPNESICYMTTLKL